MTIRTDVPSVRVVPFAAAEHLAGAVAALARVRAADPTYPPPQDADPTVASLTKWLLNSDPLRRWVAVVSGQVAGHVLVASPHDYLTGHLARVGYNGAVAEIGKLFVDPLFQRHGVAPALFRTASQFAVAQGMAPALAVVDTSNAARRLYCREGMVSQGTFVGLHGLNHVFVLPERL